MYGLEFVTGLCVLLAFVSGEPQLFYFPASYQPNYYPQYLPPVESSYQPASEYFRGAVPSSYQEEKPLAALESRIFFNSFSRITLTYSTTTSTSTSTVTTYCTTSTAALVTCSPAGRRRRGAANSKIFYDETKLEDPEFSPWVIESDSVPAASVDENNKREARSNEVATSFESNITNQRGERQLIAFAVSTTTVLTTSTLISTLTAVCSSTTGFNVCGSG